jgi:GNAT superfamily N-acetyltransferase
MSTTRISPAITIRLARPDDARECGRICFDAFYKVNADHNFPPEMPVRSMPEGLLGMMFSHPGFYTIVFYTIVAESGGRIVGSNCLDERSTIFGVGPITIDPAAQNSGIGRQLMQAVLDRAAERGAPGVRLLQSAFHNRSLSLYTKLGFDPREPISVMTGSPLRLAVEGCKVRAAQPSDISACDRLCLRVHGHTRSGELADAVKQGQAFVVEREGGITGYTTGFNYFGHSVAESNRDLQALIGAAENLGGPGFLVPTRNASLFRWCLEHGMRVVQPNTLMSMGLYNEPSGAWFPSILY